jgi:transcriptional regulator with XRE-family HTH domain
MPSFQITIKPSKRAAGRFVRGVRRAIQKAFAEEQAKRGLTQTAMARAIGVHRSVINRELRGKKDITLGRVAELAWVMNRKAVIDFPEATAVQQGSNLPTPPQIIPSTTPRAANAPLEPQINNILSQALSGNAAYPVPVS